MARPIKLTEELKQEAIKKFGERMDNFRMRDGKVSYTDTFSYDDNRRASVVFTSVAFAKMTMLVQHFGKEVAWHGVCVRDPDDASKFRVTDILVYPQATTATTVDMDQEKYSKWINDNVLVDDRFCDLQFQGHSHVNMSVSPSAEDIKHQTSIIEQLPNGGFYVFAIVNKKFDMWFNVFDLQENTMYDADDIDLYIGDDGVDLSKFIKDAEDMVKPYYADPAKSAYPPYRSYYNSTRNVSNLPAVKTKSRNAPGVNEYDSLDDYYSSFGVYD